MNQQGPQLCALRSKPSPVKLSIAWDGIDRKEREFTGGKFIERKDLRERVVD